MGRPRQNGGADGGARRRDLGQNLQEAMNNNSRRNGRRRRRQPASAPRCLGARAGGRQRPAWPTFGRRWHAEWGGGGGASTTGGATVSVAVGGGPSVNLRIVGAGVASSAPKQPRPLAPAQPPPRSYQFSAGRWRPCQPQTIKWSSARVIATYNRRRYSPLRRPRGRPTGPGPTIVIAAARRPQQQRRARRIGVPKQARRRFRHPQRVRQKQSAPAGPWRRARS